ncbi:hypothetical protein EV126DRAFT_425235 [Verticillium dahliae]|nr:hypothetical protein EV126DRAFT_425235 [Verticillium dahliae]
MSGGAVLTVLLWHVVVAFSVVCRGAVHRVDLLCLMLAGLRLSRESAGLVEGKLMAEKVHTVVSSASAFTTCRG